MIFEDQYGVGDVIDLGDVGGIVESVSLRVTRMRDVDGTVWYVRNGEILRVGNQSQNWARSVLDISVGYGEDLARVRRVLSEVAHDLWEDETFRPLIIEEPEVWGVESLDTEAVVVRVALKTVPLEQWRIVARDARADQDALRRRGHRDPVPPARRLAPRRRAGPATTRTPTAARRRTEVLRPVRGLSPPGTMTP